MELNMARTAQLPGPKERQVSDISPGAIRGDKCQFEFRLQKAGFCRDLKRAAVIFRPAHNEERCIYTNGVSRHRSAKHGEVIFRKLAKTFLPVGENSSL